MKILFLIFTIIVSTTAFGAERNAIIECKDTKGHAPDEPVNFRVDTNKIQVLQNGTMAITANLLSLKSMKWAGAGDLDDTSLCGIDVGEQVMMICNAGSSITFFDQTNNIPSIEKGCHK